MPALAYWPQRLKPAVASETISYLDWFPTVAGLAEGVWSSIEELAGLWDADAVFEPQLPAEFADALHAVWLRAVEKSMAWAAPEPV